MQRSGRSPLLARTPAIRLLYVSRAAAAGAVAGSCRCWVDPSRRRVKRLASRLGIARETCTNRCVLAAVLMAVVALAGAVPVGAQDKQRDDRLADDFAALLSRRDTPANTCMSVSVDGEQIIGHRDTVGMIPASLMKLATLTAAIELMGADEQFVTTVAVRADDLAAVRDGVLHGDVYLIGGGDPVLATPRYMRRLYDERPFTDADKLADAATAALASHGVQVVDGAVVGDGSRYADNERDYTAHEVTDPAEGASAEVWKQSYRTTNLVGPLGGLTLNDGYRHHRSNRRAHVRSPDPAQGAASVFDDLLEVRGVVIRDRPRAGAAPGKTVRVELASISSPPLGSIVGRIRALLGEHRGGDAAQRDRPPHRGLDPRAGSGGRHSGAVGRARRGCRRDRDGGWLGPVGAQHDDLPRRGRAARTDAARRPDLRQPRHRRPNRDAAAMQPLSRPQ